MSSTAGFNADSFVFAVISVALQCALLCSHLVDLLLVQVKDLSRGGGGDLLVGPVARLRAVPAVPGQHKHHLGTKVGRRVKRITTARCLLSTDSLSVGSKVTLMLSVMLRVAAETEQL